MPLPRIAITMGDPAGVGPEICLRLLQNHATLQRCVPIIFGDATVLSRVATTLSLTDVPRCITMDEWPATFPHVDGPAVLDMGAMDAEALRPGSVDAATGAASYRYIDAAISAALRRQVDAVATAPIHKEALCAAGVNHPGHTEIFAEKTKANRVCMMLTSESITCSLVTTHVGYREVPELLTLESIVDAIELSADAMRRLRGRQPRLVVCGLNPHAGEHGLFGHGEEERLILPAIESARHLGIDVEGPLPPDTAFLPNRRSQTDCYICMYHDQGLIPLKALAFDHAVNITLGLPIIRTSVDHGTALDIAWTGKAEVSSLVEAVRLATQLTEKS